MLCCTWIQNHWFLIYSLYKLVTGADNHHRHPQHLSIVYNNYRRYNKNKM